MPGVWVALVMMVVENNEYADGIDKAHSGPLALIKKFDQVTRLREFLHLFQTLGYGQSSRLEGRHSQSFSAVWLTALSFAM